MDPGGGARSYRADSAKREKRVSVSLAIEILAPFGVLHPLFLLTLFKAKRSRIRNDTRRPFPYFLPSPVPTPPALVKYDSNNSCNPIRSEYEYSIFSDHSFRRGLAGARYLIFRSGELCQLEAFRQFCDNLRSVTNSYKGLLVNNFPARTRMVFTQKFELFCFIG